MHLRLAVALLAAVTNSPLVAAEDDILLADFESPTWGAWTTSGAAFGKGPARGTLPNQMHVSGYLGERLVNSFVGDDTTTGTLISPEFIISRRYVVFLVGGGRHPGKTAVELRVGGELARTATGSDSEELDWQTWDVADLGGRSARIRIVDEHSGGWGHINADHFLLSDSPRKRRGEVSLEEYRKSPEYYRERYRPQFHFTPEINWMNDPNGLVYFDGEYHLFYQHNPFGNKWGHMSWGHAVSRDLVRWEHLPIALLEEDGVMIFSGCAVVDHRNSSGFGTKASPPLVAIYTGHQSHNQSQHIAYSTDRGRTWTKYSGNPVIDIGEKDFRDPKVFWHEPTSRWVMVVALAAKKVLQFWDSKDLKSWEHLSDFGPAGAAKKANWECPDLFELPIEGTDGETRWVLEVDMGNGAPAGGSGGEYFVGEFDGVRFKNGNPSDRVLWVDWGRDFYAPVSFSDIPESDGRRIWLGWLNNWQTCLLPTSPWRSAQSIPRLLSLRRTSEGLRLIQRPVKELETLRRERVRLEDVEFRGTDADSVAAVSGDLLEIVAVLAPGDARECGLAVRRGKGEETIIAYDAAKKELFVDRTRSGDVTFDPRFPGRHAAPFALGDDGLIRLHIFVDTSCVEVFAEHGLVVLTERIFPSPESRGVALIERGTPAEGKAPRLVSLTAWKLASIWR